MSLLACCSAGACFTVSADRAEQRLLQSWGMQVQADGRLGLKDSTRSPQAKVEKWSPDLSIYQDLSWNEPELQIEPVVLDPSATDSVQ